MHLAPLPAPPEGTPPQPMPTTPLPDAVAQVFAAGGLLAQQEPGYRERPGQQAMAQAVAQAIAHHECLVVEAGTGIGKTYAYLVPALLSGQRVLISTATKALQDQLRTRDLPHLARLLGLPLRMAMLKGRSSYLCLHRLQRAPEAAAPEVVAGATVLAQVHRWAQHTRTGDLAELPALDEHSPLLPWITSDRDNCLGSDCAHWQRCHLQAARREAMAADVVVTNHHLFFADLAVRESGVAELLPSMQVLVFDEAHRLNDTGVQFLGWQTSTGQWLRLVREVRSALPHLRLGPQAQALASAVDAAVQAVLRAGRAAGPGRRAWEDGAPEGDTRRAWAPALAAAEQALGALHGALAASSDGGPEPARLAERAAQAHARVQSLRGPTPLGQVRWVVTDSGVRWVESPLDVAATVRAQVFGAPPADGAPSPAVQRAQAWVFTSATLGDEPSLRWFVEPCGLQGARVLQVASPFDYARQAAWYVPEGLPLPSEPTHSAALARWLVPVAQALQGRTLVLTTTVRAMHAVAAGLRQAWGAAGPVGVLVQGEASKRALLARFRGGPGQVLVATASFWEGVDLPGEVLQLVVIDKLPFPPPGDPMVEARSRAIVAAGGRPFTDHALPEAAVALKQGAGRLIRHEEDRGLLVIGDRRLLTQSYGPRLLAALPPMRGLRSAAEFQQALAALTRTSTTGPCGP